MTTPQSDAGEAIRRHGDSQAHGRREDSRLLTGNGRFTDDIDPPGTAHAVFLRAPVAHAEIAGIDLSDAAGSPGVLGIVTGADLAALGTLPCSRPPTGRDGRAPVQPPRRVLTMDRVRHVGEPMAMVVAETLAQAMDGAERIRVDLKPLPAVTDVGTAIAPDTIALWPDAPGNVCLDWESGDAAAVATAFAKADHMVRLQVDNNRLVVNAMEPRAAVARYDGKSGRFTLECGSQGVITMRDTLATEILHIDPDKLRVVSGDVGGGFGMKTQPYPEYAVLLHAAKAFARPIKWTGTRSEGFLTDNQARDGRIDGELALTADGEFLGLKISALANMGAYLSASGPGIATRNMSWCLASVYRTPAIHTAVTCVFTNTAPIGPYRGAGRPEANYIVERLIDQAAHDLGIDPVALRRRNLIADSAMPYSAPVGMTYDSGAFETVLDRALEIADWDGFSKRRAATSSAGRLRGIGIACFLEHAGARLTESARLRFDDNGRVVAYCAAQSQGQGHFTSFAQLIADRLAIPLEQVEIREGDSDLSPKGGSTTGSRSMAVCGGSMIAACDQVIDTGRSLAGQILEAAAEDISYSGGRFRITGTDKSIGLGEIGTRIAAISDWPSDLPRTLDTDIDYEAAAPTFPNGCHICEVEIDPETGQISLQRYSGIDDVGVIVNPMIVDGQLHGGVVQGAGQALMEHCLYDADGQLVTGSFLDYAMPRADQFPTFDFAYHPVPCTTNPIGVKGAGESGTIGAIPAVANAIMDALRTAGVEQFDMPASPNRIWHALKSAHGRE